MREPLDLVFIHPAPWLPRESAAPSPPPGYLYLPAGVFGLVNEARAAGYSVAALDEPLECQLDPRFDLDRALRDWPARVYAVDVHWHEHAYGAARVAHTLRARHPRSRIVAGGLTATWFGDELRRLVPEFDCVVQGYGEGALVEQLDALRAGRPAPPDAPRQAPPDLDRCDYVTHDWLHHAAEYRRCSISAFSAERETTFWLKTGHGCAFDCAACGGARSSQQALFGNARVLRRSPARVAGDIAALHDQGVGLVKLTHDPGAAPRAYWRTLHATLRDAGRRPGVYFECLTLPASDYLADFARTFDLGASILALTPHTHDESVRRRNGKPFTNAELWACLAEARRLGVRCALHFTRGLPFSDATQDDAEIAFREELQRAFEPVYQFDGLITLDPGSPMAREPRRFGIRPQLRTCADYLRRGALRSRQQRFPLSGYVFDAAPE